ncbi:MAG: hypothetical protein NTZ69_16495 [Bacteroidia bacterium]|nr:hypothetical protein [Bacteroidia bacterium]
MEIFAIFLTGSLISLILIKPKKTSDILLYSIIIPILIFTLLVLFNVLQYGIFYAGKALAESFLPCLISILMLFIGLKGKTQSKRPIITFILLTFSIIAWGISGYTYYKKSKIESSLSEADILNKIINNDIGNAESDKKIEIKYIVANYKEVSLSLPDNWNYKPQEIIKENTCQITCWEKGGLNSFAISWIRKEFEIEDYLNFMKKTLNNVTTHKDCVFSQNVVSEFRNNIAITCTYTENVLNNGFRGKLICFKNNGLTYLIIYQGNNEYNTNGTPENIISSLNIDNLKGDNENQKSSDIQSDWTVYEIDKVGKVAIPPSMEIRDTNSYISLVTEVAKDYLAVHKKIALNKPSLLFQPKGTNERDKEATAKYSRIIINYYKGESGDYYKQNDQFSSSEKEDLNNSYKQEVISSFDGFGIKLIQWFPMELVTINNIKWHKIRYIRQMSNNQPVYVECYRLNNDNEAIDLVISYRNSEKTIWENDFKKVAETFIRL